MPTIFIINGKPHFELGRLVATPGALAACSEEHLSACLNRHARGDWGTICKEDAASNQRALREGSRIIS